MVPLKNTISCWNENLVLIERFSSLATLKILFKIEKRKHETVQKYQKTLLEFDISQFNMDPSLITLIIFYVLSGIHIHTYTGISSKNNSSRTSFLYIVLSRREVVSILLINKFS
jgi:hypothetical protein